MGGKMGSLVIQRLGEICQSTYSVDVKHNYPKDVRKL